MAYVEGLAASKVLGGQKMIWGNFGTNNLMLSDSLVCSMLELIDENHLDMVYTHWSGDGHLDHKAVAHATIAAARHIPRLFMYRANYYDGDTTYDGRFYTDISDFVDIKTNSIKAHESEYKRAGEKWLRFIMNQNQNDGQKIGVNYAECFQVVKYLR